MPDLLVVCTSASLVSSPVAGALERAVPEGTAVERAGGLLAPAPEGGLVRDVARDRDVAVVVLAAAGPDMVNHALLTVEGARAAGLAVAAVVVDGSADPPALEALRRHAGVDVVEAGDAGAGAGAGADAGDRAVADWPVEAWLAARPEVSSPPAQPGAPALDPHVAWEARPLPDPRSAGRPVLMAALEEIVAAEGPVVATRAYSLYNRAAGGRKLTSIARAPLSGAAYWLAMERRLVIAKEADAPWQGDDILRLPGQPAVHVRALGTRTLEEVPLEEVAELMRRLRGAGEAELKRGVLRAYGLVRLTARADEYLGLAQGLLGDGSAGAPRGVAAP